MASSTSPKNSASTFLPNLGSQREAFLNQVETQIAQYVKKEGKNCLAVIERNPQSEDKTYTPSMISKFPPAFFRFLLDKKYHGHEVESALVAPIVAIISDTYRELLNSNAADLAEFLNGQLAQNIAKLSLQEIREHCAKQAARTAKAASTILKGKGHLVSASVVKKMSLKPIVAHGIETFLAKMIGETVIKKTIEAAGLETFAALVNKVVTEAWMFYLLYQAMMLPERLGKALGAEIRSMLEGSMRKLNQSFLQAMNQELVKLSIMDVISEYTTSMISEVVEGDRADVCKKLIEKLTLGAHPLDGLFGALWDQLKSSEGLEKGLLMRLIKKKKKDLQKPAAGEVLKRLQELLSKTATMSVTEIIASLISIRLCTVYNVK
ncbi:uncharacterized protein BHQ10_006045 [Talaromyces amestolkiae]|uniref:Uncharacterized protein n=1 Tax=Talaromyces amestolkiae TaxID=1196081 RepID=A0A364L2I6_TALAM|nr:uncharacterized protein BHQ10_006045 [Talaromyces amestolkiae]RAO70033.1 hypothetical protein BHQ10_006045 [Talaromyces amestolkiae]